VASKNFLNQTREGLLLSDDEGLLDIGKIHAWLSLDAYWALGRDLELVTRTFKHSYPFGVYEGKKQVAVARIVSDTGIFAVLCDVFVDREYRGRGIGTWLSQATVEWTQKLEIKKTTLTTSDAHAVYSAVGFQQLKNPDRWMELERPSSL
jgi:GNAT superfamily N-acetyltransferase